MRWNQVRMILWLRWRLTRNQWSKAGWLNAAVTLAVSALGLIIAVAGGIVGLLLGLFAMDDVPPRVMLIIWDGVAVVFLFFWLIGVLSELQRAEAIDIGRLLHMPISLKTLFLINYLASHVTLSVIIFLPASIGLAVGLAIGRNWTMIALLPLVVGFLLMITAWTYHLRGWLVTLMANPRRYRMVVGVITMAFVLLFQLPNIVMNLNRRRGPDPNATRESPPVGVAVREQGKGELPPLAVLLHRAVPFLWVGGGAMSLAEGSPWPAILGAGGGFALAGLGLGAAYRSTRRFYEGSTAGAAEKRRRRRREPALRRRNLLERIVPGVPEEVGALALASFRSLSRATEVRMGLLSEVFWLLLFGGMTFMRRSEIPGGNAAVFVATGAVVVPFFGLIQLFLNQFGFDRAGFRSLVLSPMPRTQILLGRNLAMFPIAATLAVLFLLIATVALRLEAATVAAAVLLLPGAFLLFSVVGNLTSTLLPYRIAIGSLKPTKLPTAMRVMLVVEHLLFPVAVAPLFIPALAGMLFAGAGWLPAGPTALVFAAVELIIILAVYRLALPSLGDLLQQRETRILQVVTQEVE